MLNECAEKEDACTEANKVFKIPDGTLKVPTKPKEKPPKVPERKPVRKVGKFKPYPCIPLAFRLKKQAPRYAE